MSNNEQLLCTTPEEKGESASVPHYRSRALFHLLNMVVWHDIEADGIHSSSTPLFQYLFDLYMCNNKPSSRTQLFNQIWNTTLLSYVEIVVMFIGKLLKNLKLHVGELYISRIVSLYGSAVTLCYLYNAHS